MTTVQLAIANRRYADQIRDLLVWDDDYNVEVVNAPNPTLDGVIVMDEDLVDDIAAYDPQRCVIIARKTPQKIASLFEQGVVRLCLMVTHRIPLDWRFLGRNCG